MMSMQVAFLRAVNVAGHASVRMADLRAAFDRAGCQAVRTYIQSGNVMFDAPAAELPALLPRLRAAVNRLAGGPTTVVFRTLRELASLVRATPFQEYEDEADVKLYVAFLAARPRRTPALPLRLPDDGLEAFALRRHDVLLVSHRVRGRFGFPNNFVEREFGVPATTRNWNTVAKLVELGR
jgi:uncharacterized protein (DUF1697 family)